MQKRKGFTLVELVIVIAVIAILAGVLIGTFASVINKANESAKLQEMKAAEHEQKADDLLKKIENSNWYGWEDFEKSIVEKMTQVFKTNPQSTSISSDDIKVAVKAALKEYTESSASQNTSLTEEQVRVIIEDAVGKISYNGVTEAQVRAIVSAAATSISSTQLTASQVKSIVNAAADKGLTAAQVAQVVGSLNLATTTNVNAAVTTIKNAIETAAAAQLSAEDLEAALIDLLPVTYKVANATDLEKALESVNSFSTLNFTADFGTETNPVTITLSETDNRTLTIAGVKLAYLTVDAPVANIYLISDAGVVKVVSVADHSFHIEGKVDSFEINQGRAVVEEGAQVTNLKAAPSVEALAKVVINRGATVGTLEANYQKNGNGTFDWIEVENNGTVGTAALTVVTGDGNVTTNVKVTGTGTGTNAKEVADATTTAGLVVSDDKVKYTTQAEIGAATEEEINLNNTLENDGAVENPTYFIRTVEELKLFAGLINASETYDTYKNASVKLVSDLDISDITWTPIAREVTKSFRGTFDGNNHTIVGLNNKASFEYVGPTVKTVTSKLTVTLYGLFNYVGGTCTIKDLTMANVDIDARSVDGSGVAAIVAYAGIPGETETDITFQNITVTGQILAFDNAGAIAGRCLYNGCKGEITFDGCTNSADITATRKDKYARAGAIAGQLTLYPEQLVTIKNCVNNGKITATQGNQTIDVFGGHMNGDVNYENYYTKSNNTNNGNLIIRDAVE